MNNKEYIKKALATNSPEWFGDQISKRLLRSRLADVIIVGDQLDGLKKTLFYGRGIEAGDTVTSKPVSDCIKNQKEKNIAHGIIGLATEASELVENLRNKMDDGGDYDETNIKEELGDLMWYMAITLKELDSSIEEIQELNIAKLQKRYNGQFSKQDAGERDLEAERAILEGKTTQRASNRDIPKGVN